MIKRYFPVIAIALAFTTSLMACKEDRSQAEEMPPVELEVGLIKVDTAIVNKEYPASVEGVADVEIRPQVSGYLQKIYVNDGAYVRVGQPLFKIDDRIYAEQYNMAKASVVSARAGLAKAKIDLDRRKELAHENIVSTLQLEESQTNYDAAVAALQQAEAAEQSAKVNLEFTTITAPISGYLTKINYRLGSLLGPTSPMPITNLSDSREVNVYFALSEIDFLNFQKNNAGKTIDEKLNQAAPVTFIMATGDQYEKTGTINAIEGMFNETTGAVSFRAKFDNTEGMLRSGNTGKIVLTQQYSDVLLVPMASTFNIQDRTFVWILDKDNKAIQKPIDILGKSGLNFMIKSGVKDGDQFVVKGFDRLQPGVIIKPKKENLIPENPDSVSKTSFN